MGRKVIVVLAIILEIEVSSVTVNAQVDCAPLDPRDSVSKEREGKINGSVATLYKIAKAEGNVEGKVKEEIQNLQRGIPVGEKNLITLRTLYLFCGMFANDKEIAPERKVNLYKVMMGIREQDPVTSKSSVEKNKSDARKKSSNDSYAPDKSRAFQSRLSANEQRNHQLVVPCEQEKRPTVEIISKLGGNLKSPRSSHISVKLPDGRVLVTGGFNENTWVSSFEIFDPKTQVFSLLQGVRLEQSRYKGTWIRDGQIVFAGSGMAHANLMFLDINTKPPTITHSKSETLWQHYNDTFSFMHLPDGRFFVAGAPSSNGDRKVEFYDPIKDEFISGQDLLFSRSGGQTATLRRDNSILIIGGVGQDARRAEIYYLDGTTKPSGELGQQRHHHTATLLETGNPGNVVVIGGLSNRRGTEVPTGFVEIHDAYTGHFERIDEKLGVPRFDHTSTLLPDGTVLIVGGFTRNEQGDDSTDVVERFHPKREKFETIGRLHTARGKHTAELLDDGSVLIIGGVRSTNGQTAHLNSTEVLGPF